jgi:hypothetical protein
MVPAWCSNACHHSESVANSTNRSGCLLGKSVLVDLSLGGDKKGLWGYWVPGNLNGRLNRQWRMIAREPSESRGG